MAGLKEIQDVLNDPRSGSDSRVGEAVGQGEAVG